MRRGLALVLSVGVATAARADGDAVRELIDQLLTGSLGMSAQQRADGARRALDHLRPLVERTPNDPELHYLVGQAWYAVSSERGADAAPLDLVERAIASFERSRQLAPDGAYADRIAFELGLLYSKRGDHERALVEYDRAARLGYEEDGTLLGNSAETLMALGRLGESIARYRAAVEASSHGHTVSALTSQALSLYGLAVALDRDEQVEKARDAIRHALTLEAQLNPHPMHLLDDDKVFFMPPGDKFYYVALAHLQRGEERHAATAFQRFLDAQPKSRWAGRARAHLADLGRAAMTGPGAFARVRVGQVYTDGRNGRAIQALLQRSEADLRTCFRREAWLYGGSQLDLLLRVDAAGRVAEVIGLHGIASDPEAVTGARATRCLRDVTRAWRVGPGPAGPLTVPLQLVEESAR